MTAATPRPNEDEQPPAVRLVVESGPRGWLISMLAIAVIVGIGVICVAALIHLLSQHV